MTSVFGKRHDCHNYTNHSQHANKFCGEPYFFLSGKINILNMEIFCHKSKLYKKVITNIPIPKKIQFINDYEKIFMEISSQGIKCHST